MVMFRRMFKKITDKITWNEQLRGIIENKLKVINTFRIKLNGISRQEYRFGNWESL